MYKIVDGEKFKCIQCGKCCRWPGYVFLNDEDVSRLAQELSGSNRSEFIERYTKRISPNGALALADKSNKDECIFLNQNKCSIYESRPAQCKEFPLHYDHRCPGFTEMKEVSVMSADMVQRIMNMKKKLSSGSDFEKAVSNKLYEGLRKEASTVSVAAKAIESGVDAFFDDGRVKIASLDDLFAFNRVDDKHLIHKATRDLWAIEADGNGDVHITRLFDSGKPVKG
jgi:Fe-S-cluster containining protein